MIKTINAALFSFILVGFCMATLVNWPQMPDVSAQDIIKGKAALLVEKQLEDELLLRQSLINAWTQLKFSIFQEGKSGVVIGDSGWLFSTEEYEWSAQANKYFDENLRLIRSLVHLLNDNQVNVYLVMIPTKIEVYQDYSPFDSALINYAVRQNMANQLEKLRISHLDSYPVLAASAKTEQMFMRTDTHWTPMGASKVAMAMSETFKSLRRDTQFERTLMQPEPFLGDLVTFIPAGDEWLNKNLEPESLSKPVTSLVEAESDDLFSESLAPELALIGTSYSADQRWDFAGALQHALGAEVVNFAEEGEGPFVPMQRFIEQQVLQDLGIRHVIWEVPVRYMVQKPTTTQHSIQELRRKE
ncbi:hypothetical protein DRW07_06290 [Alteromonas sediminis]|uniref:AlgX/AlgJ SGNH hydrolase-like domain-containing protein n=1 Tax=Alteromonas sediminis TaxID=2259342 RepID=A0A3N5Y340_9ALTE|nr:hypothetical protein [Alteromonas sediminis]RPJ67146.1 hypothetical protein DRW07_06290 [Alteromonas sediminis]